MVRLWAPRLLLLAACLQASTARAEDAGPGPGPTPGQPPAQPRGLEGILPQIDTTTHVASANQLLTALNASAGSSRGEMIVLQGTLEGGKERGPSAMRSWIVPPHPPRPPAQLSLLAHRSCTPYSASPLPQPNHPAADIRIRPQDVLPFEPWLPIDGGDRTVILRGSRADDRQPQTLLDFGSAGLGMGCMLQCRA